MKKVVLAATTALVAAGSAAALEVTLGGSIETEVSYAAGAWNGPDIGGGDSEVSLAIAGESMGWTYGATIDLMGDLDDSTVTLGSAGLGSLSLSTGEVVWSGMDVAGFAVTVTADISDIEASSFGLVGSLGGLSIDATVDNDDIRTFSADIGAAVSGASVGIEMSGNLADTSDVVYTVDVGMAAMGLDLGISMTEGGTIGVSAGMGALTVEASATSGDLFGGFTATYSADLAEGLSLEAVLGADGSATTLDVTTTLSF